MITREMVIKNAKSYLNIQSWQPSKDTHEFNPAKPAHTFHSAFAKKDPVRQVHRQYNVMPYVYGGFDTITNFLGRINKGVCPGGWDRVSAKGTKHWYDSAPQGFGYGYNVPRNLAGIDCSGYVSRCLGLTQKHSTQRLPDLCVKIDKSSLKRGDILNKKGHVRIFDSWAGPNRVYVYEAVGGGKERAYNIGDEFGCVVYHAVDWSDSYTPYSPFPQFIEPNPPPGTYLRSQNPRPTISVKCKGRGNLEICRIAINGQDVAFIPVGVCRVGMVEVEASYTPNYDLSSGSYRVDVIAINTAAGQSFRDEYSWEFDLRLLKNYSIVTLKEVKSLFLTQI